MTNSDLIENFNAVVWKYNQAKADLEKAELEIRLLRRELMNAYRDIAQLKTS